MSFRDTFTRGSGSQNLRYDDAAAYHFYLTLLSLLAIPLAWSIIKTLANPFAHLPSLSSLQEKRQFRDKIAKFKKENRYAYITFGFVLKIIVLIFTIYGIVICSQVILSSSDHLKGFDPYEILGIQNDAPIQRIKKAYRKLALLYHPDRNPDNPEASAKFIIISKAYECLTDEQAKQKCLKYGNPDGAGSFNVGIALPQFLVRKQNHLTIMGIVFILVVIILPIYLIHYHSEMNKYDDFGMLADNLGMINHSLNQHFTKKDTAQIISCCGQFANLNSSSKQITKLQNLQLFLTSESTRKFLKKSYRTWVKKVMCLVDARINELDIPVELQQDYKLIMKKTPTIIKSSINLACQRAGQMYKGNQIFTGKSCIDSLIFFQQYFIQGKNYDQSDSFTQLDLSQEEIDKVIKKKKNRKITSLWTLINKQEQKQYFLGLLDNNRSTYIRQCLNYFPSIQVQNDFKVQDQSDIGAGDFFQIIVTLKTDRLSNFCSAPSYPFLKKQGWYIILSQANSQAIIYYQFFQFDQLTKSFKITYRQEKQGKYCLSIKVMSDCYFGLDYEEEVKYQVKKAKEHREEHVEEEVESESYIQKVFKSLVPQEQEEVSDTEEEKKE